MIPELIAALSLAAAAASGDDGDDGIDRLVPRKDDEVRLRWNRFRIFRTPAVAQALGMPDLIVPVALGADPPSHTGTPRWDFEVREYSRTQRDHTEELEEDLWWPTTSDDDMPTDVILKAVYAMGIVPARETWGEPGALLFIDQNHDAFDLAEERGKRGSRKAIYHLELMDSTAQLEALKWGFNLAAIRDDTADSPEGRYYRWYVVHPWPATYRPNSPPDHGPHKRAGNDAVARARMKRGKLFERAESGLFRPVKDSGRMP